MTVKVRVRDFQSVKDATLDIQGFTVVTGPNNSGKTAFMRAIRGAVQNTRGSSFVRRGAAQTTVDLTFDDGHTLTWEKGAKVKPTYTIDGGAPVYPGQGVPDEVRALGIRPIKAGGEEIWPQIAPQFHQVFLIDEPGSVLAEAVADVDRVGHLNEALKSSKSDQTRANSTLTVRQDDVKKLTEELAGFDGLDDVVAEVKVVEAEIVKAGKIRKAVEGFGALRDRLHDAVTLVESLAGVEQIKLPPDAIVQEPGKLLAEWNALLGLKGRLDTAKAQEAHWEPLDGLQVPPVEEMSALRLVLDDLEDRRRLSIRLGAAKAAVAKWAALEGLVFDADETPATKLLTALGVITGLQQRWKTAIDLCASLEIRVQEAEVAALQAEADLLAFLAELGTCPVCNNTMNHGH